MTTDNTPLRKYKLVNLYTGETVERTTLTAYEASCKNYAFGLNGRQVRWVLAD